MTTSQQNKNLFEAVGRKILPILGILITVVLWQTLSATGLISNRYFPSAWQVGKTLVRLLPNPALWYLTGQTLLGAMLGLALACVIAVPFGLWLGSSDRAYRFFRVLIEALRPIPPVVILPLAILLIGSNIQMKVVLVAFGTTWPLLIQSIAGAQAVDPVALETVRSYRISSWRRLLQVTLPAAQPFIMTGFRMSAAISLIVSVVTEIIGGVPGLGNDILKAQAGNSVELMYSLIVVVGLIGVVINQVAELIERPLLFWHPTYRGRVL